ncbi:SMI1/KNR4 family protein [Candidatus Odyssella thessalonicensis]|uniref:SMI1/KNR4 family protein n=1 Tax=Candidatus Odyssella thessalonicensis TaxID=84647 RepID=UPI000225BFC2|nr:SMI1/KNR4 family protein [Candidatus Odyssella thessalonicensis]
MNIDLVKRLDESLNEIEGLQGGPCSRDEIMRAEAQLLCKFSKEYKDFLEKYGAAIMDGYIIHGLRKLLLMTDDCWSVIDRTKFYKEDRHWPGIESWYVISDDGAGNPIGIDPEGRVWVSDHDADFEKTKLADNFEEFLDKILSDTLYQ